MRDITIVGCGIGGLNLGLKLIKKYGRGVTIYDKILPKPTQVVPVIL